jgi:hypothetical protein
MVAKNSQSAANPVGDVGSKSAHCTVELLWNLGRYDLTIQFVSDSEVDSFLVTDGRSLTVFAIVVDVGLAVCKDPDPRNLYLDKMTT